MKVLSVKQPWANLIANGKKIIENRTWKTKYRGELYIHASGSGGAIIAKCELIDIITPENALIIYPEQEDYIQGDWCWILKNIVKLDIPIIAKGHLGIWNYNPL